jgi:pimeloyl-ACP methyl ester carboxylesterase
MTKRIPVRANDLRGYGRLAIDATLGLTQLVENLHHNILRTPGVLGTPTQAPAKGITGLVYKTIRGVTRLVGGGVDAALSRLVPLLGPPGESTSEREAVLAALNGVLGDHLAASANPLAIPMQLRRDGRPLSLSRAGLRASIPAATGKILLLAHGLCMNDLQWQRHAHDHGAALAADGGYTPLYLHYNSGLHISSNGRELADQIENLLRAWPLPVHELVILAHSMGGLVSRSACRYAQDAGHEWLRYLRKIIFLGTPHDGAPLERGGNWIDVILGASPYTAAFARLGKIRSAGITDLRYGSLLDEDWLDRDRFARAQRKPAIVALPQEVQCYAIAASIARKSGALSEKILGDGLVQTASALGQHDDPRRRLSFAKTQQWVGYRMNHLDLLDRKEVYAKLCQWLAIGPDAAATQRGKS